MTAPAVNPDLTVIPDQAEVWLMLASDVTDITPKIPTSVDITPEELAALGWLFTGLVDDQKGIPLDPSIEVKKYDAFGHPKYRVKLKKGELNTGFTALEWNDVTRKVVLPGSGPKKIGIPKNVQIYILYRFVDEDVAGGDRMWVSLRPAAAETKSITPIAEGEQSLSAEVTLHHTADAAGDVFQVVDETTDDVVKTFTIDSGVTGYTVTVDGQTTASITAKTKTALQAALRLLSTVTALPDDGVTVDGPTGGPLVATFTGPVTTVTATGTGGTVTVS